MKTECCGRQVNPADRYCPSCGWEFRALTDTSGGGTQEEEGFSNANGQTFHDSRRLPYRIDGLK